MKKHCFNVLCVCIILVLVAASFLQPLQLVSGERTRIIVHLGKTVQLTAIAEVAGEYRCYINDKEYFWVPAAECEQKTGEPLRVKFSVGKPALIYRSDV